MKPVPLLRDSRGFYWIPELAGRETVALFTTRGRDYARPDGGQERARLAAPLGITRGEWVRLRQVHGAAVAVVGRSKAGREVLVRDKDAAVTNCPGIALSVLTADCLPVILVDGSRQVIGIAHAGWRGIAAGILGNVVRTIRRLYGSDPAGMDAYIGPGIRPCCYRVGGELRAHFSRGMRRRRAGWYLDLPHEAAQQLARAGLARERIGDTRRCSACDPEFYSHRRQDGRARMLSLVMRPG